MAATSLMDHPGFPKLLSAQYDRIREEELTAIQDFRSLIYDMTTSDRQENRWASVSELLPWNEFVSELEYQQQYEGYEAIFRAREYASAMQITKRMVDDDLSGIFHQGLQFRQFVRSAMMTRLAHAAQPFEMANILDETWYTWSENVPLASASHTTTVPNVATTSGFSNLTVGALTPVNLRSAMINYRKLRASNGERMDLAPDELIVPVDLVPRANEILKTMAGLDTPFGNVNMESSANTGLKVVCIPRWSKTTWACLSNSTLRKEQAHCVTRIEPEYGRISEFDTFIIKGRGYLREGMVFNGWQFGYWFIP